MFKQIKKYCFDPNYRRFYRFETAINKSTINNLPIILNEAIEYYDSRLSESIVTNSSSFQEIRDNCIQIYKDKYVHLKQLRILVHKWYEGWNVAQESFYNNLISGLLHLGIEVESCYVRDENFDLLLNSFNPSVLLGVHQPSHLTESDISAIIRYRANNKLKIGFMAYTKDDYKFFNDNFGSIDFIYGHYSLEYMEKIYERMFQPECKLISIEFAANPYLHYPISNDLPKMDYIFLGTTNYDKQKRYISYFSEIFSDYNGIISGPGWRYFDKINKNKILKYDSYFYSRAKIGLNLSVDEQIDEFNELNERTYQLAACGIPQLIDNPKLLLSRFGGESMFVANNDQEYFSLFKFMLSHPDECEKRAFNAFNDVYKSHTIFHRAESLIHDLMRL